MKNREAYLLELKQIIEEALLVSDLSVSEETKADDIDDWDSITHIEIIVGIEEFYNIKFSTKEIEGFKNVGFIINAIEQKLVN